MEELLKKFIEAFDIYDETGFDDELVELYYEVKSKLNK